ncbi:MAG: hypothetical protein IPL26_23200 [Leptospiraceae bacterium]|nr:hypothetical protein [Leptospiraceae bacterium]
MKLWNFIFILLFFPFSLFAENVLIGIYIVNIGKFDVASGSFTIDFYLTLKTEKKNEYPLETFEFMNGRATHSEKIYTEDNLVQYRILANLSSPVDLRRFPFDEQTLSISIENKKFKNDLVKYTILENETGIDEMIAFTGWNIRGWKVQEKDHFYKVFNETYSLVSLDITIEKIIWNAFFKTFLPVLIIIFLVTCSFIMDIDKVKDRLGVCTSGLVASVMFHLSISNQIPPVSYLTIADKFMILTYIVLMFCVILNVAMLHFIQDQSEERATLIHSFTKYGMFALLPSIYGLFFLITSF